MKMVLHDEKRLEHGHLAGTREVFALPGRFGIARTINSALLHVT